MPDTHFLRLLPAWAAGRQMTDTALQVCSSGSSSAAGQRALKALLSSGVVEKVMDSLVAYSATMLVGGSAASGVVCKHGRVHYLLPPSLSCTAVSSAPIGPLPTAHCPLPTAHCPLPTAHCPLPTAHTHTSRIPWLCPPGAACTTLRSVTVTVTRTTQFKQEPLLLCVTGGMEADKAWATSTARHQMPDIELPRLRLLEAVSMVACRLFWCGEEAA
jgi:hypothetical protein